MNEPYHQRTSLRVRVDECDATRAAKPGSLFGLVDEARFELYEGLAARGVRWPLRHVAKAERFEVVRTPGSRELVTAEAWIGRVGRTSLDVAQRLVDAEGTTIVRVVSTLVALGHPEGAPVDPPQSPLAPRVPVAFDPSVTAHAHDPFEELGNDAPQPPDNSVAFLRTLDAWPSDENQGRHVARTRMVDWLNDARRLGVTKGAFEHTHRSDAGPLVAASFVFEREGFAGDGLRIAIASAAPGVFDAVLVRGRDVMTRARLRTS